MRIAKEIVFRIEGGAGNSFNSAEEAKEAAKLQIIKTYFYPANGGISCKTILETLKSINEIQTALDDIDNASLAA